MTPLRVAIVGAGMMGRWHACYALRAGAQLTAIVDPNAKAAAAFHKKFPTVSVFADLQNCLARDAADVVHICTPSPAHESLTEAALRVGKHVLVEKPAAQTRSAAEKLIALATAENRRLVPVHQFPFQHGFRKLRSHLAQLGTLVRINLLACTTGAEGLIGQARQDLLLEILPHPISLFRALCPGSLASSVWTVSLPSRDELELSGVLNNLRLNVQISLRGRPPRNDLTIIGIAGTAHLNLFHGCAYFELGTGSRRTKIMQPFTQAGSLFSSSAANLLRRSWHRQPAFPGLAELIAAFYRSIRDDRPAPIDNQEILEAASFLERVHSLTARTESSEPFRYDSPVPSSF